MVKIIKKIKSTEYGKRFAEKFFPNSRKHPATSTHFNQAIKRFNECNNKKNASQIKQEIRICKNYWKCYPYHYYIYDLFRADIQLTNEELINYIPHFFWYELFLNYYDSQKFSFIADNKIVTHHVFKALNICMPKTLCILFKEKLFSSDMVQLTFDKINQGLFDNEFKKIFVKPAKGSGGKGFFIFHKNDHGHFVTSDNIIFNENFLGTIGKKTDYIIQAGIIQDQEISNIYPGSVNTCRIITENKDGIARVVCAMLRMGRGQNEVDNISSGGICTYINVISGKFGDFAISYTGERFEEHPVTHFAFRNFKISRWDEIQRFTIESAGKLPFFTFIGWDIALTADGPIALEINLGPAIDIIEMTSHGLREAFGITNPDYYWKNAGKRAENLNDLRY
jgi:hypothetical protein